MRSIPARAGEPMTKNWTGQSWTVYPRACGGTRQSCCFLRACGGLSPRVRGNLRSAGARRGRPGSIPARAGEPFPEAPINRGRWVYPRACGGTLPPRGVITRKGGLSPRVRGNHIFEAGLASYERSIPARAGEPVRPRAVPPHARVYPRACGGTCLWMEPPPTGRGLSPRVRGNRFRGFLQVCPHGSIPARAGEPTRRGTSSSGAGVYPRACGGTARTTAGLPFG